MGLNLLEKTELWVNEITLENANLSDMADVVAEQLGLEKGKVLVVDVRPRHITFDVLEKDVPQAGIMGKEQAILSALSDLPGVHLTEDSYIHSNGILGLICAGVEDPAGVLDRVSHMTQEIQEKVAKELSGAVVVNKDTFGSQALADMLYFETIGQDEVEIELVGLCTDICVVSNAILLKTRMPEVKVIIDASCCAGVTSESHAAALTTMQMCQCVIK